MEAAVQIILADILFASFSPPSTLSENVLLYIYVQIDSLPCSVTK